MGIIKTKSLMGQSRALAKAALYLAAILWGASFTLTKNSIADVSPIFLLAIRFTIAFFVPSLFILKRFRAVDRKTLIYGTLAGIFMFIGGYFQTVGLRTTSPGKSSFLTSVYCVMVPLIIWLIDRKRPRSSAILAAFICITGIAFVSLSHDFTLCIGDFLTLLSAAAFAAQIVVVTRHVNGTDLMLFTLFQFCACMILSWIGVLIGEGIPAGLTIPADTVLAILYLGLVGTALAHFLQNFGQKRVQSSQASMILSLESVFGVVFSLMFFGENLTTMLVTGFALIFLAVVLSESDFQLRRKNFLPDLNEDRS
jgi:drug/metabolite transporter (DMT)-like permease